MTNIVSADRIGIIILAAGGSARFGRPKQLAIYEGTTLLRRAVDTAARSGCDIVIAVLGAAADELLPELEGQPVTAVVNNEWQSGVSSSIKLGLETLRAWDPDVSAVVFVLCDQPFITSKTISRLAAAYRSERTPIVACSYDGTVGVPALFASTLFDDLMCLEGDVGARSIIKQHTGSLTTIPAPGAAFDVDREVEYQQLVTGPQ